ncbi:hypothetical protein C8J56DRAFT_1103284, partial [Mycena floridula]
DLVLYWTKRKNGSLRERRDLERRYLNTVGKNRSNCGNEQPTTTTFMLSLRIRRRNVMVERARKCEQLIHGQQARLLTCSVILKRRWYFLRWIESFGPLLLLIVILTHEKSNQGCIGIAQGDEGSGIVEEVEVAGKGEWTWITPFERRRLERALSLRWSSGEGVEAPGKGYIWSFVKSGRTADPTGQEEGDGQEEGEAVGENNENRVTTNEVAASRGKVGARTTPDGEIMVVLSSSPFPFFPFSADSSSKRARNRDIVSTRLRFGSSNSHESRNEATSVVVEIEAEDENPL